MANERIPDHLSEKPKGRMERRCAAKSRMRLCATSLFHLPHGQLKQNLPLTSSWIFQQVSDMLGAHS
jgi:hypothetical protein